MPGPIGPRDAAGSGNDPNSNGPRIVPCGKPTMLRQMTALTWPDSLCDGEDKDDEFKDYLKDVSDKITSPKPPGLRRGWSNLSNISSSITSLIKERTGPRLQYWKKPPLLRSMTSFSWISDRSGTEAGNDKSPYESSGAASNRTDRPQLKKGASHISFASWQSGTTSDSHRNKRHEQRKLKWLDSDLEGSGERNITFQENKVVVMPQSLNEKNRSQPNKIRTARFTLATWLPKSLFYQFQRIANIYFLLICFLVMFKFSPKDWKSKVFPFMGVLIWTALKDLHEDRLRRREDEIENKQKTQLFDPMSRTFKGTIWQDVFCGDVLMVSCDEAFPADMVLLHAGGSYEAFISTISLDGETNLKERRPPPICDTLINPVVNRHSSKQQMTDLKGDAQAVESEALKVLFAMHTSGLDVRMGKPEVAVTDVKGTLSSTVQEIEDCPLLWNNFLPRGCTLRNTSWVLGLVVYIGDETKVRLNTAKNQAKISNMQVYLNYCVWGLLMSLLIVCLYSATLSALQADTFSVCCGDESWIIRLAIFLITFYHVVPMSLYVVFEMLKLLLGYQVNNDKQMICPETGECAVARTADLIEEMGQISFIFSDKTGTLTRNEMVFARCCVDGMDPGDFRRAEGEVEGHKAVGIDKVCRILEGTEAVPEALASNMKWFFTCIGVCHTVQVQPVEQKVGTPEAGSPLSNPKTPDFGTDSEQSGKLTRKGTTILNERAVRYLGMSPDEVALVEASRDVGIVFAARSRNPGGAGATSSRVILSTGEDQQLEFCILYELEFNSDRKRMSVVCQHAGEYYCITKGADSVMEDLATQKFSPEYRDCLKVFSQQGLRTLVIAMKKIDAEYFRAWEVKYNAALSCLDDSKDAKVAMTAAQMEQELHIVGITAVEDRLQDGVPQAIATVKEAGIRVWVLTGDKTETAVDIAKSCQLFNNQTQLAYATEADCEETALAKLQMAQRILDGVQDGGLVLDGRTIQHALMREDCQDLIYKLGLASRSCVCCRLTPLQKRQLVELVHRRSPSTITLAIGDGANDVPMIEGAHLGIAVRGKEGAQAVQVSDVAISQFRFLVPLLLCHGRRAYRRIAVFLCYYLYKNVALAIGDVAWMHQDRYRGRIAFPEYLSVNYNFLFTSWHILFVLGFDSDVPDNVAVNTPSLYLVGPSRQLFNGKVFSRWMVIAVYHGIVAWLVPNLWFGKDVYDKKSPGPFWVGSCATFTIIIFIAMGKLLMSSVSPFKLWSSILPTFAALVMYVFVLVMIGYTSIGISLQPNMESVPEEVLLNKDALISIFAVPPAAMTVDFAAMLIRRWIWPSPLDGLTKPFKLF